MDGVVDISSGTLIHEEAAEQDVDINQSFQQTNGHHENGTVSDDPSSQFSADLTESRKENNVEDADTNMGSTKMDGLQEHPTLAEEIESELPRKSEGEVEVTLIANGGSNQTGDMSVEQEKQSNLILEGDDASKHPQTENNPMATELVVRTASTQTPGKSLRSESLKVHEQSIKVPTHVDSKNDEEEDSCSVGSSTATPTQDLKDGSGNGASGISFSFRCDERAEKRKAGCKSTFKGS